MSLVSERTLDGESIVYPPSHCNSCGRRLKWIELIPLFSYIALRGKCKGCGARIGIKNFIYEIITPILINLAYFKLGLSLDFLLFSSTVSILMIMSYHDTKVREIDDTHLSILVLISLIGLFASVKRGEINLIKLILQLGLLFFYLIFKNIKKVVIGEGDLMVFAALMSTLTFNQSLFLLAFPFWLSFPLALWLFLKGKRRTEIPFIPFICLSYILVVVFI